MTNSPTNPALVVHHHYFPIRGWIFQKGNYVMVQFLTDVPESEIAAAFTSPTSGTTIDTELVNHLKTMVKGQAIKLPKDDTISSRSLKVRVNKAAKIAGRKLGWAEVADGHIARVLEIQTPSSNGTVNAANVTQSETTPEASPEASSSRNRR